MDVDHAWNERSSAGTAVYSERYGTENGDFSEKTHGRTGGFQWKDHTLFDCTSRMEYGAWVDEERLYQESRQLGEEYKKVAERLGIGFTDAGKWDIPVVYDGVHFSRKRTSYICTEHTGGNYMVKVDLITGFLGSGKTTFIKKYARYLMDQGYNIGILENDFGAVNVDMMLLRELESEQCELEMVAGGCDKDCHRRRFKTKLIAMGMCGYDRVLIEPSGIFDMDEFFDALHEEPLDRWYQIGNVIAVVDVRLDKKMSEEADYILASEVADAGCIVLSKTQEASGETIQNTIDHLNRALETVHCKRRLKEDEIIKKDWEQFENEDFERIMNSGYIAEDYEKMNLDDDNVFQSKYFMDLEISKEDLREAAQKIMEDPACGSVFRIKGFTQETDGSWTELNATHHEITLRPIEAGQKVIIVIGEHLEEEEIRKYLEPDKK